MAGMPEKPSQPDDAVTISPIAAILLWLFPVGAAYAWMAGAERTGALALIAVGTTIGGAVGALFKRSLRGAQVGFVLTTLGMFAIGVKWEAQPPPEHVKAIKTTRSVPSAAQRSRSR
jgi:hypothetical protein